MKKILKSKNKLDQLVESQGCLSSDYRIVGSFHVLIKLSKIPLSFEYFYLNLLFLRWFMSLNILVLSISLWDFITVLHSMSGFLYGLFRTLLFELFLFFDRLFRLQNRLLLMLAGKRWHKRKNTIEMLFRNCQKVKWKMNVLLLFALFHLFFMDIFVVVEKHLCLLQIKGGSAIKEWF